MPILTSKIYLFTVITLATIKLYDHVLRFEVPGIEHKEFRLVIGVLSAQNNTASRESIRRTWKTLASTTNTKFYFIVGDTICPYHPADRKSELSCEEITVVSPGKPLWTGDVNQLTLPIPLANAYTFRVGYPVVFRHIRVSKHAINYLQRAKVRVKNARTGSVISVLHFSDSSNHQLSYDAFWIVHKAEPYIIPKGMDIEIEFLSDNPRSVLEHTPCEYEVSWLNINGAIDFTTLRGPVIGSVPFHQKVCVPFALHLELHDIKTHLSSKEMRRLQWNREIKTLRSNLEREALVEGDILFLDLVDVYKNIPKKALLFYKWALDNLKFHFLLKTDDDTFIDIEAVQKVLEEVSVSKNYDPSRPWWWAKHRYSLPVERHGKWQELVYDAPVYPPFPCGGGYVLNKEVISFLGKNSQLLHCFQGEDTSLGIWLAALHPSQHASSSICLWSCADTCSDRPCNVGQLSIEQMYHVWNKFRNQEPLCGG